MEEHVRHSKIRALVVDDEPPARDELRYLLEKTGQVLVLGEFSHGREAIEAARAGKPDVVFLDVQMPGMDGFEVAERLLGLPSSPLVVFATAYDEYAVRAFEVHAVDYLLKPFQEHRVRMAVERIRHMMADRQRVDAGVDRVLRYLEGLNKVKKVPVDCSGRILLLEAGEIVYAFCRNKTVYVRTYDREYPTHFTLQELSERLGHGFLRVHKGYIVNLRKVVEILPWFQGAYLLVMDVPERTEVPVSRRLVKEVRAAFGF